MSYSHQYKSPEKKIGDYLEVQEVKAISEDNITIIINKFKIVEIRQYIGDYPFIEWSDM